MKRKVVRLALASIFAAAWSSMSFAQPSTFLTVNAFSYHLDRSREYNESNGGVGIEHVISADLSIVAGFYRNSRPSGQETSTYGAVAYTPFVLGPVRAGMMIGAVTGYQVAPILPAVTGLLTIGGRDAGVNIHLLPSIRTRSLGSIGLQLKKPF